MNTGNKFLGAMLLSSLLSAPLMAASKADADALEKQGKFGKAADIYAQLLQNKPDDIGLRLSYADMLAKDKQWNESVAQYNIVLKKSPKNKVALRSLGTVHRWRGDVDASLESYRRAQAAHPKDVDPVTGMAATYAMDHDFSNAHASYQEALKLSANSDNAIKAYDNFKIRTHPRVQLYYEDDLSFMSKEGILYVPLFSRHEVGAGWHEETSLNSSTGDDVYVRDDNMFYYNYFLGHRHKVEFRARKSTFEYPVAPTAFSAIDEFEEYRLRYIFPFTVNHGAAIRYTHRPTVLIGGEEFDSHKTEVEFRSSWTPRFRTVLGGGWLKDLDSEALTVDDTINESLVKAEIDYLICHHIGVAAKYITNPDLDASVESTSIAELSYDIEGPLSFLLRYRFDDYKKDPGATEDNDQDMSYIGMRYVPNRHWWSEVGVKHVERGPDSGTFPLVSVVLTF